MVDLSLPNLNVNFPVPNIGVPAPAEKKDGLFFARLVHDALAPGGVRDVCRAVQRELQGHVKPPGSVARECTYCYINKNKGLSAIDRLLELVPFEQAPLLFLPLEFVPFSLLPLEQVPLEFETLELLP